MRHIALPSGGQALVGAKIQPATLDALDQMCRAAKAQLESTRTPSEIDLAVERERERFERWMDGEDFTKAP